MMVLVLITSSLLPELSSPQTQKPMSDYIIFAHSCHVAAGHTSSVVFCGSKALLPGETVQPAEGGRTVGLGRSAWRGRRNKGEVTLGGRYAGTRPLGRQWMQAGNPYA